MLGGLLAMVSAACFGLNNAIVRRGVLSGTVAQSMVISVPLGMVMFMIAVPIASAWGALTGFTATSYGLLIAAGFVHFIGNRYFVTRAIKAMGSNLIAPFQQVGLLWTLALAIYLLDETFSPVKIVGIVLVMGAPALVISGARKTGTAAAGAGDEARPKPIFVPAYREGITFALLSALSAGTSPVLVRLAMPADSDIATGIAAATVSYAAATVVILAVLTLPGKWAHARAVHPKAAFLFFLSGIMVNLSQLFRYMALAIAPVSVVTPIQHSAVAWRLVFSRMINPEHELFTWRVILASAVSITGAVILTTAR